MRSYAVWPLPMSAHKYVMDPKVRHTAGSDASLQFVMSLNLIKAGLDETRSDFVSRFIEFWCQKNCVGAWRVEETSANISVWFDLPRDVVLFKISDEYDYLNDGKVRVTFKSYEKPVLLDQYPLDFLPIQNTN
jgi:hypothetical protein